MYADYVLLFGTLPRANLRLPPRPGMSDMNLTILAPIENSPWQFDINLEPPHLPPVFPGWSRGEDNLSSGRCLNGFLGRSLKDVVLPFLLILLH